MPSYQYLFPQSQIIDMTTGEMNREWRLWFQNPSFTTINLGAAVDVTSGGTGLTAIPTSGQLLIGNGNDYTLANLTQGTGLTITNGIGSITLALSNTTVTASSYGNSYSVATFTVNGQGQLTAAANVPIAIGSSAVSGTSTNDLAAVGIIGEYKTGTVASGGAAALTTAVAANVTGVSLTAGDWDVTGTVDYTYAGATNVNNSQQGISIISATLGPQDTYTSVFTGGIPPVDQAFQTPLVRISLAATTTVYLVAKSAFTIGSNSVYGTIRARRVR
jgi:hypothetical protein